MKEQRPKCPQCGRRGIKQGDLWWCRHCTGAYDDDPEEGGNYDQRDPSRRMQRQERGRR